MSQQMFAIDELIREAEISAEPQWNGAPLRYHGTFGEALPHPRLAKGLATRHSSRIPDEQNQNVNRDALIQIDQVSY